MTEGTIFRLDPTQLAAVRQKAGISLPTVNEQTTPHQAGFQLGMLRVLQILQDGFTVQHQNPPRG